MVNRNLLRQFDGSNDELQKELDIVFATSGPEWLPLDDQDFRDQKVVNGRVVRITDEGVWIDVGYKSEGVVEEREWFDEDQGRVILPQPGDTVPVLLEAIQDENGAVVLSYYKARRQQEWDRLIQQVKIGDMVSGVVTRKIKGGLLVNIGASVFLPASQLDIRRTADVGQFIGKTIECKILDIDEGRRNMVVSRRQLIEDQRTGLRAKLLAELEPGQIRKGIVRNIADFGAFIDLGGIDGLLHITDMSWGRISNPHDVVKIDQELEVFIIRVDKVKEKIALGLKQKTASPWESIEQKYPIGSRHAGEVVNVMPYGAFVKLEPGIEGLVHVSEMSWTRRIAHPSEVVNGGDPVEVQVLNINKEKREISLGMKQVQADPWEAVAERYPAGTVISGPVRSLTNYGAFIEIEEGIDGLLHVSDMSWVRKVNHPSEVVSKGASVTCSVLSVDRERKRIALGLKQLAADPWQGDIPGRYQPGERKKGKVTKLTNFGVFVELEPGLEGLLHISELADHKVERAEEVVKVGDEIEVAVLRVDTSDRKIGLSYKRLDAGPQTTEMDSTEGARPERALRGGTGSGAGHLFRLPEATPAEGSPPRASDGTWRPEG